MTKRLSTIAAGLGWAAAGIMAQSQDPQTAARQEELMSQRSRMATPFQQLPDFGFPVGRGAVTGPHPFPGAEGPFSAREERKTTQTLGDGTLIEKSETDLLYRDAQGRTRVEQTVQGKTAIAIVDPVAGVRLQIDPESKTVTRIVMAVGGGGGRRGGVMPDMVNGLSVPMQTGDTFVVEPDGGVRVQGRNESAFKDEDLGQAIQNGVSTQGTRRTLTIPQGQIGNSREIHVVNERWYSRDLQMMVKTINSDPRFGVTTYELTSISQSVPDPALFQIPIGYTVAEQAGGRGRGATGGR